MKSEEAYSILDIVSESEGQGVVLTRSGSICVSFELREPECYSLTPEDIDRRDGMFREAFKFLPDGTYVHKQDVFLKERYCPDIAGGSFLDRADARHFRGRLYVSTTKHKYGASTISQQTAKNVFLWPGRSWVRKGFEVYFTALIEMLWGKHRIMEVYLNSIEMGDGIYGADAVAKYHFSKTAEELTRSECALIAATLPNPRKFDSSNPTAYLRARRGKIEFEMKFMPLFPKEGEDYDPSTASGGIYKNN